MLQKLDRKTTRDMMRLLQRGLNYEKHRAETLAALGALIGEHQNLIDKAKRLQRMLSTEGAERSAPQSKPHQVSGARKAGRGKRKSARQSKTNSPGTILEQITLALSSVPGSATAEAILRRMKDRGFKSSSKKPLGMIRVYLGGNPDKFKRVGRGLYELNRP